MADLLSVPFKKSSDVDIVKPLKNLIQSTYNSEDYTDALNELSRLRSNAIWKIFEKSSLEVIYSYYDQLVSLESKLPPQEVQIPFKWKDAFDKGSIFGGRMSLTISSLSYERVCILFNMAAMQSAQAASETLETEDSLKLAAKLLQQAAGIFSHLKSTVLLAIHGEPTPDLSPDTLHALTQLMLAQAQEVIAYKCIKDEMKESMVAKVCGGCADLYAEAARALQREQLKHLWDRDWITTVTNKQQWFTGLSQWYQAGVCRAAGRVGEEIARLRVATAALATAGKHPILQEQLRRASARLTAASKDNDFIYHERIPEPSLLEPVPRATVAKPTAPPQYYSNVFTDQFAGLSPAAVHRALAAVDARRTDLVTAEINKLRDSTQLLNSILASLNLPACVEGEEGGALPDSIRTKGAAVRDAGGVTALKKLMQEMPDLLQRNREILDEAERMLNEERTADNSLREQFGGRWTRTPSDQLTETFRANIHKYRQIIDNAVQADRIVQDKFNQHKESMELLGSSESEIAAGVPAAEGGGGGGGGGGGPHVATLRALMQDVEALKAERDSIESALKAVTVDLRDEFTRALQSSGTIDEPALSAPALHAALEPHVQRARSSLERQAQLVADVQRAHSALMSARGGASGRDGALSRLCAAYDAFQELTGNLNEGTKFYNDLTQLLVAFQNKVSDFCFARRTEKEELLKDLTQEASRGAPSRPAPSPPSHHAAVEEPPAVRREAPPRPPPPAAAAAAAAPLPYPTQPQGMPLPYATPYYYAAPPMPVSYNPYATLPYPHHARGAPPSPAYLPYQYPPAAGPGPAPPAGYQPPPGGYNPYPQQ